MSWTVLLSKKALKQTRELPEAVQLKLRALLREMEIVGPVRGNWPNYSKLTVSKHHCHLKDGRPSYVACWEVLEKNIRLIEVYHVGTREKAPY